MGYQEIHEYPQKKNFLLSGMCLPQYHHQGPKGVGCVPPGGLLSTYTGENEYQQICWVKSLFIVWMCHLQHQLGHYFFLISGHLGKCGIWKKPGNPGNFPISRDLISQESKKWSKNHPKFRDPEISRWRPQTWKLLKGLSVLALHQNGLQYVYMNGALMKIIPGDNRVFL